MELLALFSYEFKNSGALASSGNWSKLVTQLSVFAGSLFFGSLNEMESFINFVGFCPPPRHENDQKLFEDGLIQRDGYVPIDVRALLKNKSTTPMEFFSGHPANFIMKLLDCRHCNNVHAHCIQIIQGDIKPKLKFCLSSSSQSLEKRVVLSTDQ